MNKADRPYGGCRGAVIAYLRMYRCTQLQIADATGYSPKAIESMVARLRNEGSTLLANLVDGRSARSAAREREKDVEAPWPLPKVDDILTQAIRSRTPLELAWATSSTS